MRRPNFAAILLTLPFLGLLNAGCPAKSGSPTSPAPTLTVIPSYSLGISFGTSGAATMATPAGLVVSGSNLWVANEYIFGFIQEWTTAGSETQSFTTYNGSGYNFPRAMTAGPDGYLYVADGSHVAVELTSTGGYVTTFGTAELGSDDTDAVAVGATLAYLLDDSAPKVLAYSISGTGAAKAFSASATFGASSLGSFPKGVALDAAGNVYVADTANGRIVKFNSAGVTQAAVTLVSSGVPSGIAVDAAGYLYATDSHNNEVQMFNASGAAVTQFGATVLTSASGVDIGIALDASGNLFVSSSGNNQVVEFKRN